MRLKRYFKDREKGIVAYAPEGSRSDYIFVYRSNEVGGEPLYCSIDELFTSWNGPNLPTQGGRRQRSLFFSPEFQLQQLQGVLENFFFAYPGQDRWDVWDRLVYWPGNFTADEPYRRFPEAPRANGRLMSIRLGELEFQISDPRAVPRVLSDFRIRWDRVRECIRLELKGRSVCKLLHRGVSLPVSGKLLELPLGALPADFYHGALHLAMPWPATPTEPHLSRHIYFQYTAVPPRSDAEGQACELWRAAFAREASVT